MAAAHKATITGRASGAFRARATAGVAAAFCPERGGRIPHRARWPDSTLARRQRSVLDAAVRFNAGRGSSILRWTQLYASRTGAAADTVVASCAEGGNPAGRTVLVFAVAWIARFSAGDDARG